VYLKRTGYTSVQNKRNVSFSNKTQFHWPSIKLFGGNVKAIAADFLLPSIHNFVTIFKAFHPNHDPRENDRGFSRSAITLQMGDEVPLFFLSFELEGCLSGPSELLPWMP
jgi:hypothetical protein